MNKIPRFLVDWLLAFPLTLSSYSKYGFIKVLGALLFIPWMIFLYEIVRYFVLKLWLIT